MTKFKQAFGFMLLLAAVLLTGCSEKEEAPVYPEPELGVAVKSLSRTELTFSVGSPTATDFAYCVCPRGEEPATAAELFRTGRVGYMDDGGAVITNTDLIGGRDYVLCVAVRAVNPYRYSKMVVKDISTNLPYTSVITMEEIGHNRFAYHIEMPAGVAKLKQLAVKKNDYEAIKAILQAYGTVTLATYLKVFGHDITESGTFTVDKVGKTAHGDDVQVHPELEYYILTGEPDADGNIADDKLQAVLFRTKPFDKSPYKLDCKIATTSTTVSVDVKPSPEIVSYRAHIASRADFEYNMREGLGQWKAAIVGYWDDAVNIEKSGNQHEYKGDASFKLSGLRPESEYVVGLIGYDAEGRETYVNEYCITTPPTGPKPQITITEETPLTNCAWNSRAYSVKVKNSRSLHVGFFPKASIDRKLAEGFTLNELIRNNADAVDAASLASAQADGAVFEINTLSPNTQYYFAAYAENDEFVGEAQTVAFTTDRQPLYGGETRANMPGVYTAKTTDGFGRNVSFDVTIATGVNDATTAQYEADNRLVCLGFGPANKYPVKLPADMVAAGRTPQEANALYGPKWFIEFSQDKIYVPGVRDEDTRGFAWSMMEYNGKPAYFMGFGTRSSGDLSDNSGYQWPVTVSADGSTITLDGIDSGYGFNYYPGMGTADSWYGAAVVYRCYSKLTLTRKPDQTKLRRALTIPAKHVMRLCADPTRASRNQMSQHLNK